jgi:hypothetical protein
MAGQLSEYINMKTFNREKQSSQNFVVISACSLLVAVAVLTASQAQAQIAPGLTITPMGTNVFSITITNNIGSADYDLQWTPVLASPSYPWTWAAIGTPGQTNFLFNLSNSQTGFFRTLLDTNAVPLWEAADPNNPATGILKVTIFSPANGATLN